jgi:hypothetical protein
MATKYLALTVGSGLRTGGAAFSCFLNFSEATSKDFRLSVVSFEKEASIAPLARAVLPTVTNNLFASFGAITTLLSQIRKHYKKKQIRFALIFFKINVGISFRSEIHSY